MIDPEILRKLHSEGGVEVMKASAGSGKTFALAREYIRLLLKMRTTPCAHRHILAVTFTNKATGEMKDRIIDELYTLSTDPSASKYRTYLLAECGLGSDQELQEAAHRALTDILSDYGGFSVSTIDRFFQQALRAFAREAGQFSEYQVEIDRDALVSESVDKVLDSLDEGDQGLLKWLSQSSIDHLESGDGYHLENNLSQFAKGFMKDSFRVKEQSCGIDRASAFSEANLKTIQARCRSICADFDRDFKAAVSDASELVSTYEGISSNLSKYLAKLSNYRPGDKLEANTTKYWTGALSDGRAVFNKPFKTRYAASDYDSVSNAIRRIDDMFGQRYAERQTAKLLRSQVALFRVADALDKRFKELLAEKNVLSLDDTNSILHDIIDGTDAPFIYEKLGVKYHYFLLDEFQDTSTIQWENFLPLLRESIATGGYNLVVGDVKQSIYRWREADWSILDERVENELERTEPNPLDSNWRSAERIVTFNNAFFSELAARMDASLADKTGLANDGRISSIYKDVEQIAAKPMAVPGSVEMSFCDSKDLYTSVVAAVQSAHEERRFPYKDIAVIVRSNSMGGEVASSLVAAGIPVISNDSLRIASGASVRMLVAQLFKIDNPDDAINTFYAGDFDPASVAGCQSLSETVQTLLSLMDPEQVSADTLYVLAFLDMVRDFVARNGNSLHAFLEYWKSEGLGSSLSSPEGSDAVTVITIHKAKGLDYPFVVVPLGAKSPFVAKGAHSWECPDLEGTPFDGVQKALYDIPINNGLAQTLFCDEYRQELQRIYIDNINVWYVAMTRASEALHIVAAKPAKAALEYTGGGSWPDFSEMTAPLYMFAAASDLFKHLPAPEPSEDDDAAEGGECIECERFVCGTLSPKAPPSGSRSKREVGSMELDYSACTFSAKGRLKVKSEAEEFFKESDSRRVRGTVLHSILERVIAPGDLHDAVLAAVMDGLLEAAEAPGIESMLSKAIEAVAGRGWFPADASLVFNERDIVGPGFYSHTKRPDRVVKTPRGIDVVDYKFGAPRYSYLEQVRLYAAMYRDLGWESVTPYIWYVETGEIVDAS